MSSPEEIKKFRESQRREKEALRLRLEEDNLSASVSASKRQKLFDLAWEYGHSAGFREVENYYVELAELVIPD